MTGPIRGPGGVPPYAVQPVAPVIKVSNNKKGPPEQPAPKEDSPELAAERKRRRKELLVTLNETGAIDVASDKNQSGILFDEQG